MDTIVDLIINLHTSTGDLVFILISTLAAIILCWKAIPVTTDLMVNHAAGISGRIFGPSSRTLVINASTNNPELLSMTVSMSSKRMGGWANPLGSLLANCYLMYFVGIIWVYLGFLIKGKSKERKRFTHLIWLERKLFLWHITAALAMFACGILALKAMEHHFASLGLPGGESSPINENLPATGIASYAALAILLLGIIIFIIIEKRLKRKRPNLFTDIDDSQHGYSIIAFLAGTAGLIAACWAMNAFFLAWSVIYKDNLTAVFGPAIFVGLHYVLGALITSLPELRVATANYRKLTPADMNTALASASYSNFTNLIICALGLLVFIILAINGYTMPWR